MRRATTRPSSPPTRQGALKHVGESYPFTSSGRLLLTADNHNSVNGIREFARAAGTPVAYAPLTVPELRLDLAALDALLSEARPGASNLFAFPAQSNFTGVTHPLDLVARAHDRGWDVRARRRGLRLDQSSEPARGPARLRQRLVLQDVRLPDGRRLPAGPQHRSRHASPTVVCRRHGQLRHGRRPSSHPLARRSRLRRRHAELLLDRRRRDRAAASGRRSASTRSRRAWTASPAGCSNGWSRCGTRTDVRWSASTAR